MPMSGARLFDYVVPYSRSAESIPRATAELAEASPAGRAPERNRAGGSDAMVPGDTGANRVAAPQDHVRTCRSCLKRIHELDETIYGIAERTDSGVATIYSAQPPAAEIPGSFADPYPGYPIHVRVLPGVPAPAPASSWSPAGVKAALKRSTCDPRVRLILKTAVAAAAVIPLAILFFNTSTAEGVTLGQMFKAFGRAPNVRVTTFDARTQERVQDAWISRKADRILIVAGQTRILHDLKAGTESSRHNAQTPSGTTLLDERQRVGARRAMDACLGFTLHDVPADAKWARVGNVAGGLELYELTYAERDDSRVESLRKTDISIDPLTRLPREIRAFRRLPTEDTWRHVSQRTLHYLTEEEMAAIMGSR
jgi:hypothetical protein